MMEKLRISSAGVADGRMGDAVWCASARCEDTVRSTSFVSRELPSSHAVRSPAKTRAHGSPGPVQQPGRRRAAGSGTVVAMDSAASDGRRFMPVPGGGELAVMSFNLRYAGARDGHPWRRRLPVMAELITVESPAVIGTQEGLYDQLTSLMSELPERYEWTGEGRLGGNGGEFTAVIYDSELLTALEADNFWLSRTPDVPGSKDWHSSLPRMATRVNFAVRGAGRFTYVNTHFDHRSAEARRRSAALLVRRAAAEDCPVVVGGDFNASRDSGEYRILAAGSPLADSWPRARRVVGRDVGTFHGYRGPAAGEPHIDWLLTTPDVAVEAVGVNTFAVDGEYPSDHFPLQAVIGLPG